MNKKLFTTLALFAIMLKFHFEGAPVFVALDKISAVTRNDDSSTRIYLNQNKYVLVNESVEEVTDAMAKAKNK